MSAPTPTPSQPSGNALLRLYWMLAGAAAIAVLVLLIVRDGYGPLSWPSFAVWIVAGTMVLARWVDIERYRGLSVDGDPATRSHLRTYALRLLGGTLAVWGSALVIA